MANLLGARLKLARAKTHILEVEAKIEGFLKSSPFGLSRIEESNGDLVCKFKIIKPIPLEWSVIVGDAIHNIRASLDLLAWQLVELNGSAPNRNTCFPITQAKPENYNDFIKRALMGADPKVIRCIRLLKTYGGRNKLLTQLHSLDITDKHRLILIAEGGIWGITPIFRGLIDPNDPNDFIKFATLVPVDTGFPLQDGDEVSRVSASARTGYFREEIGIQMCMAESDVATGLPIISTLTQMHQYVTRIVNIFEKHFFK